jgi:thymidylate synthase
MLHLPEYHNFPHIARAPWPVEPAIYQLDWITAVDTVELWLNEYCGPHWAEWAYTAQEDQHYWEACIAFKRERNKTLFLLRWASR